MDAFLFFFRKTRADGKIRQRQKALAQFSSGRYVNHWSWPGRDLYVARVENSFRKTETANEVRLRFGSLRGEVESPDEALFSHLELSFGKDHNQLRIESGALGLFPYFYTEDSESIVVSNFFPALHAYCSPWASVDELAMLGYLKNGVTPLGRTLLNEIKINHPLFDLILETSRLQRRRKPDLPRHTTSPSQTLRVFQEGLLRLARETDFVTLTGGADSRLILASLPADLRESTSFLFEDTAPSWIHTPWDRSVVRELEKTFHLNVTHRLPVEKTKTRFGVFSGLCQGLFQSRVITGMYGGELLGGAANTAPLQRKSLNPLAQVTKERLNQLEKLDQDDRQEIQAFTGQNPAFALSALLMTSAFLGTHYSDFNWSYPYILNQKKKSPFLNTQLVTSLLTMDPQDLRDYRFYSRVLLETDKVFREVPLHSPLARLFPNDFQSPPTPMHEPLTPEPVTFADDKETTYEFHTQWMKLKSEMRDLSSEFEDLERHLFFIYLYNQKFS